MRDQIEFEDPTFFECDCCGDTTTRLTRFVSREGDAFAVYFAAFTSGHGDFVSVLAGFGEWGENATPTERTAIAFRIWTLEDRFQVGLVDAEEDGWSTDFLGRKLTRAEALESVFKQEVFDLSDHIVECDRPIIEYLESRAN